MPPSKSKRAGGFHATRDSDEQPSSCHCLSIGETVEDVLKDLDDKIFSPNLGMHSQKVAKLLPYPSIKGRRCYQFEGKEVVHHCALPCGITKIIDVKSFENLAKTNVVFSSSEMEDVEATMKTLLEVASWMDWLFDAAKTMVMKGARERAKV